MAIFLPVDDADVHALAASRLGVELIEALPVVNRRSFALVQHEDGCRSLLLLQYAPYGIRVWHERELDRIERAKIREGLEDTWFLDGPYVPSQRAGCEEHTSVHWRSQSLPAQRSA